MTVAPPWQFKAQFQDLYACNASNARFYYASIATCARSGQMTWLEFVTRYGLRQIRTFCLSCEVCFGPCVARVACVKLETALRAVKTAAQIQMHLLTYLLMNLQASGHEQRGLLAQWRKSTVRAWKRFRDAGLSAHQRTVASSDKVLPAVPGSHGQHRARCTTGDRRVSVAVPTSTLELQYGRRQLRVRTGHRQRYI